MNEPDPIPTAREVKRMSKYRFGLGFVNHAQKDSEEESNTVKKDVRILIFSQFLLR